MALITVATQGGLAYTSPFSGSADLNPVYINKKLLQIIQRNVIFQNLAVKTDIGERNGRTARWNRYERIGLPFEPATEGVTPTDTRDMVVTPIEATTDQWIDLMKFSDRSQRELLHDVVQIGLQRMGTANAELVDREIQKTLNGGGMLTFPDASYTARSSLTAGDTLNTDFVGTMVSFLRDEGVPPWEGDYYYGVITPYEEMDLMKDQTYRTAATQKMPDSLMGGRLVTNWMGVHWVVTNHVPYLQLLGASTSPSVTFTPSVETSDTGHGLSLSVYCLVTGVDKYGFERYITAASTVMACDTSAKSLKIVLSACVPPIVKYRVYVGTTTATMRLHTYSNPTTGVSSTYFPAGTYYVTLDGVTVVSGAAADAGVLYVGGTTSLPVAPITPPAGIRVHRGYVFGQESFGNLALGNSETHITPDTPTDTDPAVQRKWISYKQIFKPVVLNSAYYFRFEVASAFGGTPTGS